MPFTMTAMARGNRCDRSGRAIANKSDLICKVVARPVSGQSARVAAVFADINKKAPATHADAARGGSALDVSALLPFAFGEPAC
jgi:hypothetical protein